MSNKLFRPASINVNFLSKEGDTDWLRSILANRILVNNKNTKEFLPEFQMTEEDNVQHPNFKSLIAKIWGEELISKLEIDVQGRKDLMEYMGKYANQSGFLHAMKTAIMTSVEEAGFAFDSRGSQSVMNFIPKGKSLIIEETVTVNKILDREDPEKSLVGSEKDPLCVGKLRHEISISKGAIEHKITHIDLEYGSESKIAKIIDKRSVIEKVKDFFKNLMGYQQNITPGKSGGPA